MVLADARRASRRHPVPDPSPRTPPPAERREDGPTRADALRRIAADVSGRQDVADLFERVLDEAFELFGVDRAGLWLYDGDAEMPLTLAAQRGLTPLIVRTIERLPAEARTMGMDALRSRRVRVLDRAMRATTATLRAVYRGMGVRAICYVPLVFGDEVLGLLVLYHPTPYAWTADERALARAFGDHMATAIGSARLAASGHTLAGRLTSIAELAGRLSHLQGIEEIAWAIVGEARRLLDHDTIRVYRVDHETGICEPIAFQGTFLGSQRPDPETLRVPIGQGLTGWVAEHGRAVRLGDASADPRGIVVGDATQPESMLIVPMTYEDVVHGLGPVVEIRALVAKRAVGRTLRACGRQRVAAGAALGEELRALVGGVVLGHLDALRPARGQRQRGGCGDQESGQSVGPGSHGGRHHTSGPCLANPPTPRRRSPWTPAPFAGRSHCCRRASASSPRSRAASPPGQRPGRSPRSRSTRR